MNKPHAHIYTAEINKWIAGTLKLPTYLQPRSPHGAQLRRISKATRHLNHQNTYTYMTTVPSLLWHFWHQSVKSCSNYSQTFSSA